MVPISSHFSREVLLISYQYQSTSKQEVHPKRTAQTQQPPSNLGNAFLAARAADLDACLDAVSHHMATNWLRVDE